MAVENRGKTVTMTAGGSLAGSQYCFMKETAGVISVASDGGADAIGVLQDDPAAVDRAGCVMVGPGKSIVKTGAVISLDEQISCDASGRAVPAATGDHILGQALEAATGVNQYITALYQPHGAVRA